MEVLDKGKGSQARKPYNICILLSLLRALRVPVIVIVQHLQAKPEPMALGTTPTALGTTPTGGTSKTRQDKTMYYSTWQALAIVTMLGAASGSYIGWSASDALDLV